MELINDIREAELTREYAIKIANEVLQTLCSDLSKAEYEILMYLIMKIKDEDTELMAIPFSAKEYCKITGMSRQNVPRIKETFDKLLEKDAIYLVAEPKGGIIKKLGKPVKLLNLELDVELDEEFKELGDEEVYKNLKDLEDAGVYKYVSFDPYLHDKLINLKKRYASTTMLDILPMTSAYGGKFHNFLRSHLKERISTKAIMKTFTIDYMKKILMGAENWNKKHVKPSNFINNVILPALKDLDNYGQVKVEDFKPVKKGGQIVEIKLKIRRKNRKEKDETFERTNAYFAKKYKGPVETFASMTVKELNERFDRALLAVVKVEMDIKGEYVKEMKRSMPLC